MTVPTEFDIGGFGETKKCGKYKIIDKTTASTNHKNYLIEFIATKYKMWVSRQQLIDGSIKDPYYPKIYGVACCGCIIPSQDIWTANAYKKWMHILSRCYNPGDQRYGTYGAIGVKMDQPWLCFEYFYKDLPLLPGYDLWVQNPRYYHIDKDKLQMHIPKGQRVYSRYTCCFISAAENTFYRSFDNRQGEHKYVGVSKTNTGNYNASIQYNGVYVNLGNFDNQEAAAVYRDYYIKLHKMNVPTNPNTTMTFMEANEHRSKYHTKTMCTIVDKEPQELIPEE